MTVNPEVEAYLDAVTADRVERRRAIHRLIIGLYAHAEVDMRYRMPTDSVGYGWIALANRKQYISLYTCSPAHIVHYTTNTRSRRPARAVSIFAIATRFTCWTSKR